MTSSAPQPAGAGDRLAVLMFCQYYLPGYKSGGPVRAVSNIVNAVSAEVDCYVVTRDRDYLESTPYADIRPGWNRVGPANVFYVPPGAEGRKAIVDILNGREWPLVYVNSFFDPMFSILPLTAMRRGRAPWRPTLLAPRGEFSPNALAIKPLKKRLYRMLFRALGLPSRVHWHTTTDHETRDARREMGQGIASTQIPDLPGAPPTEPGPRPARRPGVTRLLLLSRLGKMKNLEGAIEALAGVDFPVEYHLYGPIDDDAYWKGCEERIARLPENVKVEYHGAVPYDRVGAIYREHDFFFLPSLGENFGHAIVEALAAGCPVILSDKTPWRGLADRGVGWDVPLDDVDGFRRVLAACHALDDAAYAKMSDAARDYGLSICRDAEPARKMIELFRSAAGRSR